MKKRHAIYLMFLLLLFIFPAPSNATEEAVPSDFIFKGGEYDETFRLTVDKPYKSTLQGPNGVPIIFEYISMCELSYTSTDENGIEVYTAPSQAARARSAKSGIPAEGYTIGLLYEPETSDISWFVNDRNSPGTQSKLWSRPLSDDEYALIGTQFTITARTGRKALLIQYAGTMPDSDDIVLDITDTSAHDKFSKEIIKAGALPGYFQIAGGVLYIQKITKEDGIPILYYEWSKAPKI